VKHRSPRAQADLMMIRARAGLVRVRTGLVNTARGLAKSYGERLRGCNVRNMNPEKDEGLSAELQAALEPLLAAIESVSERIAEYNQRIEKLAQESYPQVAVLKQVKGVGTLIALTFLLTLEDPHRFDKSRDVGCYLGLQPGRRNSGQSEPQLHITKEGDPYLRTLLVQGAQHILGPFGVDCDLRRCGLKLAERGGRNGKKRAIVATARKLAVLLHHLWVSGEVYELTMGLRISEALGLRWGDVDWLGSRTCDRRTTCRFNQNPRLQKDDRHCTRTAGTFAPLEAVFTVFC
jgi:transposase